jgi:hypothetical protein
MKIHALAVFRQPPERLNCAQAVLAGYQAVTGDCSLPLAALKPHGAGRAPEGLCGALHAACTLAPERAPQLKADFLARIGALRCQDIDAPCPDCVGTAAELLTPPSPGASA